MRRLLNLTFPALAAGFAACAAGSTRPPPQPEVAPRPEVAPTRRGQEPSSFVARVVVTEETVTFVPRDRARGPGQAAAAPGGYTAFFMRVTGPDHFSHERRLSGNQELRLAVGGERARLADGLYTIEITAQPRLPAALARRLEDARNRGDEAQVHRAFRAAGVVPERMVHATTIRVSQGRFVDPSLVEPER